MQTTATTATPPSDPTAHLPDDPALLKAMLVEVLGALRSSQRESEQLRARLDALLRRLYGPRAERFDPNQPLLFAEPPPAAAAATPPPPGTEATKPRRPGHGRGQLPSCLPRQRRIHELTEVQRRCPCCGLPRAVLGQEVSEQLEYVPASLLVIEHVRLTYACTACERERSAAETTQAETTQAETTQAETTQASPVGCGAVSTFATAAKPAQPLGRGLPGPGLLAHVIVSKYADHLPLYRLEHIFSRQGVPLSRQTLCGWLAASAALLRPLYQVLVEEVLQAWVVGTDDTPVPVQEDGRGQTRQGRVWVYLGDAFHPYVVYAYTPNREQAGPQRFLANYLGYLQADAYAGYDALYATGRIVEVGCWAHARRKFYEAQETDPERSLYALGVIRQLYGVERQADAEIERGGLSREEGWWLRLRLRQERALPLLTRLCQWLHEQRGQVLPRSPIGGAIGYACNLWPALARYATQGYLAIDNNAAERALRAIAVGRKNYLFFGSDGGGETAAVLYSLVQSCKRLGIEPWRYLREVLEHLPNCAAEGLPDWLPDRWAARARAAVTGPAAAGVASWAGP